MAQTEQFSLRWNNFHSNLTSGFQELYKANDMVDVTLAVDGHVLNAHKIVLAMCSPYFKDMFKQNPCPHPIVILKDIAHDHIKDILEFMYMGQVNVLRDNLRAFLRTAEVLQVKGLTENDSSETSSKKDDKSDSVIDQDEEPDLMHFNQMIDSDVELPAHYSPVPTPPPVSQSVPAVNSKRPSKNSQMYSNCKRSKDDGGYTPLNKIAKMEQIESNAKQENVDEYEYYEEPSPPQLDNDDTKNALKHMIENNMNTPGSADMNSSDHDVLLFSVDEKGHVYCPYCYRKFVNRYNLKVHIRDKHEDSPTDLDCRICGKVMRNRSCLRVHMYHHRKQQLDNAQQMDGSQQLDMV